MELEEIIKPYEIIFPVDIEGSVNGRTFSFKKGEVSILTYPEYEAIMHSSYKEFLL